MTPLRRAFLPLLLIASTGSPAAGQEAAKGLDWPQWRGPERTNVSQEPASNLAGTAETLWTKELGLGHSSFAIAKGRVYTLGYDAEAGLDSVYCLDAASGAEVWRHSYPSEIWDVAHDGGTLTTPTVVGDVVYTSNREGKVFCFAAATGEVRWTRDLRADLELEPPTWGFSASPLVVGDRVILNIDRVVALDRHTGEEDWVSERGFGIAYSTPTAFELGGRAYLAVLSGSGLAILERELGAESAFHPWSKDPEIYPMSPVVLGDRIFISAGYNRGCAMLRFADGKLSLLWESRVMRNKMTGCVLWNDHLYGFDESILKCIDLDGNERWRERGMGTGSMAIAGGRLLILDGRGRIIVAEANPDEYVELSRREVFDGGTAWSTPVLSQGRVYCRSSLGQMSCLRFSGPSAETPGEEELATELPTAKALVARHVESVGGHKVLERLRGVRMVGTSKSLINTVRAGEVELVWEGGKGFAWRDTAGFQFGFDLKMGWDLGPRSLPTVLKDERLAALQEAGDLERLVDPSRGYTSLETVELTSFEGRRCFAVAATTPEGYERTLYFDVDSGHFAGHRGERIRMWTLSAYREFNGVLLPTEWAFFEPLKGESATIVFADATINPELKKDAFAVPEALKPYLRTPEELKRDTVRLTKLHAAILGDWVAEDNPEDITTLGIIDGFLAIEEDEGPPTYLSEPDENGVVVILSASFVTFTPQLAEDGVVQAIQVDVGGEPRDRLVRPAE